MPIKMTGEKKEGSVADNAGRQVAPTAQIDEKPDFVYPVSLVSSSPSIRSIVRIVVIVLLLLAVRDFIETIISSLGYLFFLLVLSIFFAYLINPLVKLVHRPFDRQSRGRLMPRSLAIGVSYLLVFTVLGLGISYLAPKIADQAKTFGTNLPTYTTSLQGAVTDFNRRLDKMRVSDSVQAQINEKINSFLSEGGTYATTLIGTIAVGIVTFAPWIVLIPILSFFFLKDVNLFRLGILRLIPSGEWRLRTESFLVDVNNTLAAYARAQLISCVLIGTICTAGFYILGNNYALLLGIIAAVLEFIPLLGPLTLAMAAILVAGVESGWMAFWTAVFLAVLRILQDYVFYPRIVREGIHLHPLAIILSVLAGEQIAGIPGVFIAVPCVALLTVVYRHLLEHSRKTGLFATVPAPPPVMEDNLETL